MRYSILPSFEKTFKALSVADRERVKHAMQVLDTFYETGVRPPGLGLKKLSERIWEVRAGLRLRVIFGLEGDILTWGIVGDHEQIRRYLRSLR
jgi:hypothetical protein